MRFIEASTHKVEQSLPEAVVDGLSRTPKTLPCRFFYDPKGSELFEKICELPEYYPTRTEHTILERFADSMIDAAVQDLPAGTKAGPITILELGSGSSYKTRLLIEAALRAQGSLHYVPIDISGDFLRESADVLLNEYGSRGLQMTAVAAEYHDALTALPPREGPRLFLFLGSNIGNFSTGAAVALLSDLRRQMSPEDRLLVGVDLVKEQSVLEAAYNDAAGVTAAFNLNLLTRINREMDTDFDPALWEHRAVFNPEASRMEMWLISRVDQFVTLPNEGLHIAFQEGEGIHTENSHKYTKESFGRLCAAADLSLQETWTDPKEWFASFLLRRESGSVK
jgi:dimethylhistidine N-methyltransferase